MPDYIIPNRYIAKLKAELSELESFIRSKDRRILELENAERSLRADIERLTKTNNKLHEIITKYEMD